MSSAAALLGMRGAADGAWRAAPVDAAADWTGAGGLEAAAGGDPRT